MVLKIIDPMKNQKKIFESLPHITPHIAPDCSRCKAEKAEASIPKKEFVVSVSKDKTKTITKITIKRGRYDDCVGWSF